MSWQNETVVFVVMWRSPKSGATKTEIRRSRIGLDRLLQTLKFMGISSENVRVTQQNKAWMPDGRMYNKRRKSIERNPDRHEIRPQVLTGGRHQDNGSSTDGKNTGS